MIGHIVYLYNYLLESVIGATLALNKDVSISQRNGIGEGAEEFNTTLSSLNQISSMDVELFLDFTSPYG